MAALIVTLSVVSCGKFFVPQTSGPGGSGGNTVSGDYFYVANRSTGTIAGFSAGTSNLINTANSPYSVGFGIVPSSTAVVPNSSYLYVGGGIGGGIFGFSVSSNGSLSLLNNGSALVSGVAPAAMGVDPTGNWLVEVDLGTSTTAPVAHLFGIDSSSGLLTQQGSPLGLDVGSPNDVVFTPSNGLVYVSLGTGGVDVLTLNSSGVLTKTNQLLRPLGGQFADTGMAVDPAGKYLFVAETGSKGLRVLSIASTGALTEVTGSPFQTGLGPSAVLVDSTGAYVYVANRTDGTVSAFTLAATGALTAIGPAIATGSQPSGLAEDTAHTHIGVANSGGSPDFQVFTIGSSTSATPGGLASFAKTTGTTASGAFAVVAAD